MSISKKAWTFPGRPYYYILYFQKLIESPTAVRQKEGRDMPGPRDSLQGKSCPADCFLIPEAPKGTYWAPGTALCEEELPCRFLSLPVTLSRFGRIPAAPDTLSLSPRGSLVPLHFQPQGWCSAYLSLLTFLPANLIPVCASSSLAFCMMFSAYKLNKQGDNTQP